MSNDWYARNPADFIDGVADMPLELIGAYSLLLDFIYLYDRPLRDNDQYICGLLKCHILKWRGMRSKLLAMGKLVATEGGYLDNPRATTERSHRNQRRTKRQSSGHLGGVASGQARNNKHLTEAHASTDRSTQHNTTQQITESENKTKAVRAKARAYAFEGDVISLDSKDFASWQKAYSHLDLPAELTAYDQYLREQGVIKWFARTSKYLANRNMEAKAKGQALAQGPPPRKTQVQQAIQEHLKEIDSAEFTSDTGRGRRSLCSPHRLNGAGELHAAAIRCEDHAPAIDDPGYWPAKIDLAEDG